MKKKIYFILFGVILVLVLTLVYFSAEVSYGVQEKFTLQNFKFQSTDHQSIQLSQISSEYIYIECWATWCPNCIRDHALLNELKHKFPNTTIVSISLDEDSFHFEKSIQKELFNSFYAVSDTMGWESKYVKLFKFEDLPFNLLLNKDRVILGRNLEANQLHEMIGKD
jgi:thiol-disulfide isomerase/thioredoxin